MTTTPDTVAVPEDLKLLLAHTLVEDLRAQHPGVEQIDNERGDLWLPGGATPQSSGCVIDVHSVASALESEVSGLIRSAYKCGWNDREGDLLVGVDRVLGLAARPAATPGGEREAIVRAHDRSLRLSAALIALVEHFERVDAGPEDKAAIKAACGVFAAVAAERGNDRSAALTTEVKP